MHNRDEAEQVITNLRDGDKLVKLPGISFIKIAGSMDMGSRGVISVHPKHVMYTQILGVDE